MNNVQNKTVMITGASGGLGREFAKIMLENGAKRVALVDLPMTQGTAEAVRLELKYGKNCADFFPCDITKATEIETTFKKVVDMYGGLDILVNNAGIVDEIQPEIAVEVNVTAVIRGSLLALDHMGKHRGGKGGVIVNIASIFGLTAQNVGFPTYCATKHAVIGFSHSLANYHYLSGVRILALCPGITLTPFISGKFTDRLLDFTDFEHFSLKNFPDQTPDNVARAFLQLIQKAENGATWVSEGGQPPYAVDFPHYTKRVVPI